MTKPPRVGGGAGEKSDQPERFNSSYDLPEAQPRTQLGYRLRLRSVVRYNPPETPYRSTARYMSFRTRTLVISL